MKFLSLLPLALLSLPLASTFPVSVSLPSLSTFGLSPSEAAPSSSPPPSTLSHTPPSDLLRCFYQQEVLQRQTNKQADNNGGQEVLSEVERIEWCRRKDGKFWRW
ncbi:hypothetical protein MMC20_007159 [Loxospora ochrophaea]|nr:hypothetical protein [Loxospora ochrophaea]